MLFRRRRKLRFYEKVRDAVWPQRPLRRSFSYFVKRLLRVQGNPHSVAAGFAAGAAVSFLPFMGFHFLLGALLAVLTRGSLLASALGTAVGNPLTFPLIWATSYWIGSALLGEAASAPGQLVAGAAEDLNARLMQGIGPVLKPMILGGAALGILAWLLFYFLIHRAVTIAQERRKQTLLSTQAAQKR